MKNIRIISHQDTDLITNQTELQETTINKKIISLAVIRDFTHHGHYELISRMLKYSDIVYVMFGSSQDSGTIRNPYTTKQKIEKLKIVFGDSSKIKILSTKDIGAVTKKDWEIHVLNVVKKSGLELPTDYWGGSVDDVSWYGNLDLNELIESEDNFYKEPKYLKIHVLDRYSSNYMSGTDIRSSITNGGIEWKKHVPRCLISYIEVNFPKHLMLEKILEKKHSDEETEDLLVKVDNKLDGEVC